MIYNPAEDSELLAKHIPRYVKGKSFLDMGTGSGIQAECARKAGAASILATDIDEEVLVHVQKKGFSVCKSNVFSTIKGIFEVIAFNPPYLPRDVREDALSRRVTTGGPKGDEITLKFIKGLSRHLAPKGVALLIVSSLTPHDRIEKVLRAHHFVKKVLEKQSFFMETLDLWELKRRSQ